MVEVFIKIADEVEAETFKFFLRLPSYFKTRIKLVRSIPLDIDGVMPELLEGFGVLLAHVVEER